MDSRDDVGRKCKNLLLLLSVRGLCTVIPFHCDAFSVYIHDMLAKETLTVVSREAV